MSALPTPESASAPWPDDLARQKAERADEKRRVDAKARAAVLAVRRSIVGALVLANPEPLTAPGIARRCDLDTTGYLAFVCAHCDALVAQGHLVMRPDAMGGPTWSLAPGFLDRVTQRGIEQEVSRVESGPSGVDGGEG